MGTPPTETPLADRSAALSEGLAGLLEECDVPGAVFALARGGDIATGGAGVLSRSTGYPVTPGSWFQIGSVTKLFTATLVMQLVDEGLVALDAPVRTYLPSFDVGDEAANAGITVRHLLTHTSGIQGDYFAEFGTGDDAVSRYCASLADIGMLHEPGELFSYCNSGFVVLGQLLETLRHDTWASIVAKRLLQPLAIAGGTEAAQAILHHTAIGHVPPPDGGPVAQAPAWSLAYSAAPAGSTLFMDTAGLVAFADMHLAGGVTPSGVRILSESSVATMQQCHRTPPSITDIHGIGASWIRYRWGDEPVLGHDGGTLGQHSFLRVHPRTGYVLVLLTNGPGGGELFDRFAAPLFAEATGLPVPDPVTPAADPPAVDTAPLVGSYAHHGAGVAIVPTTEGVRATITAEDTAAPEISEQLDFTVHSLTPDALFLASTEQRHGRHQSLMFPTSGPAGHPSYLHIGGRVFTRVAR